MRLVGLQYVSVLFPDHTNLLLLPYCCGESWSLKCNVMRFWKVIKHDVLIKIALKMLIHVHVHRVHSVNTLFN